MDFGIISLTGSHVPTMEDHREAKELGQTFYIKGSRHVWSEKGRRRSKNRESEHKVFPG